MKLRVGILGATGAVGQKFIRLLEAHPWFEITAVAASERSAGRAYKDAVNWMESSPIPARVAKLTVQQARPADDGSYLDCDFVFSGLDASVAGEVEEAYARAGFPVISNARNFRMHPDVPLLIPEINASHTALLDQQNWGSEGFIVTNPNCSTVGLTMALKPLDDAFGVRTVQITTLQALSGAGYPGVSSLDALGNVVPHICGEEEKIETEPLKLLGALTEPASISISAQCNRVPVIDGHTACVSVSFTRPPHSLEPVRRAFREFKAPNSISSLPSSPSRPLDLDDDPVAPQPRRHVNAGNGMTVTVGQVKTCPVLDVKFVCLVHNTIRGAAGGAILNAELLASEGKLKRNHTREHGAGNGARPGATLSQSVRV